MMPRVVEKCGAQIVNSFNGNYFVSQHLRNVSRKVKRYYSPDPLTSDSHTRLTDGRFRTKRLSITLSLFHECQPSGRRHTLSHFALSLSLTHISLSLSLFGNPTLAQPCSYTTLASSLTLTHIYVNSDNHFASSLSLSLSHTQPVFSLSLFLTLSHKHIQCEHMFELNIV